MKIMITGGCGFIGTNCAEYFAKKGHLIILIDDMSRKGSKHNRMYLLKNYNDIVFHKIDVRDFKPFYNIISMWKPDAIIHTAAQTAVTTSLLDPIEDFTINVVGTFNLLESVKNIRINNPLLNWNPKIVYCSTNKVYGELPDRNPTTEDLRCDISKHTPYGVSKYTADLYMREYAESFGLKTGVFRMSCIYGTHQFGIEDQGWVAHFIISAIMDKEIRIFGDGTQVRDILFVEDLAKSYESFIMNDKIGNGLFNMGGGPENTISLLRLIDILKKELNKDIKVSFHPTREGDQHTYISCIYKANVILDWNPEIKPIEGIRKLIKWVKEHKEYWK